MDTLAGFLEVFRWVIIGGFGVLVGTAAGLYLRHNWPNPDIAVHTVFLVFLDLAGLCSFSLMMLSLVNGWGPLTTTLVMETLMGYVIYGVATALPILLTNSENM